jgi:hypothetical protein
MGAMDNTQRDRIRSAPLNCRRELTQLEVRRELLRAEAIRSQSRAQQAQDVGALSKSRENAPAHFQAIRRLAQLRLKARK